MSTTTPITHEFPCLNPDILREIIREKERGYINTLVNLFLYPRFIALCERDIADRECSPERREALRKTIESHKIALLSEEQSRETWEHLISYLRSFLPEYAD